MATIVLDNGRESLAGGGHARETSRFGGSPTPPAPPLGHSAAFHHLGGPEHYPRLLNYDLMCPDMTNVVDNRWTMRSQPFNTATKWWTVMWPCGSKSNTSPAGAVAPWMPLGSGSTLTSPSTPRLLFTLHCAHISIACRNYTQSGTSSV